MKSILISIKPKWCALMMNGDKTIEVRTSKALASAIQKLIDEYGYADIYVYCTKEKGAGLVWDNNGKGLVNSKLFPYSKGSPEYDRLVNGKVLFKFRCYKVEEIGMWNWSEYGTQTLMEESLCIYSCLNFLELKNYLKGKRGHAIHISKLKIFDKPKELSEFKTIKAQKGCFDCPYFYKRCYEKDYIDVYKGVCLLPQKLTAAPQNFCYVESEE